MLLLPTLASFLRRLGGFREFNIYNRICDSVLYIVMDSSIYEHLTCECRTKGVHTGGRRSHFNQHGSEEYTFRLRANNKTKTAQTEVRSSMSGLYCDGIHVSLWLKLTRSGVWWCGVWLGQLGQYYAGDQELIVIDKEMHINIVQVILNFHPIFRIAPNPSNHIKPILFMFRHILALSQIYFINFWLLMSAIHRTNAVSTEKSIDCKRMFTLSSLKVYGSLVHPRRNDDENIYRVIIDIAIICVCFGIIRVYSQHI